MNTKRVVGITLMVIVLLLLAAGVHMAQSRDVSVAEAPRIPPAQPAAQMQSAPAVDAKQAAAAAPEARTTYAANSAATTDAATTTQTFPLQAGWNAIYLEVEPINTSPLVNIAPPNEDPVMVHEKSTVEVVFGSLQCDKCLESVWTWNTPTSQIDYIVDPSEGLWDAPGWRRYIPEQNVGPDGASRAFLTDLANLHANTAYLVKLKDDPPDATYSLTVTGTPVVEDHHWVKGSYNLAGFPIAPDDLYSTPPTVDEFLLKGLHATGGAPPITEIRTLNANGNWSGPMAGSDLLEHGAAYLVYYAEPASETQDPEANYTAPLHIMDAVRDGLAFTRGAAGRQHELTIENLSAGDVTVSLQLIGSTGAGVALYLTDPVPEAGPQDLSMPVPVALGAYEPKVLKLALSAAEQTGDGAALLQISSDELGTRWLLPVSAEKGSLAGLWVGDVVVNDVSEGRLGTTDVAGGLLTIALRPREDSGITGRRRAAGDDRRQHLLRGGHAHAGAARERDRRADRPHRHGAFPARLRLRGHEPERRAGRGRGGLRGADRDADPAGRDDEDGHDGKRWRVPVPGPGGRCLHAGAGSAPPDRLYGGIPDHEADHRNRPACASAVTLGFGQRLARIGDSGC